MSRDERLAGLLRRLDRPAEPSAEFQVALLARLVTDRDTAGPTDVFAEHPRGKPARPVARGVAPPRSPGLRAAGLAFVMVLAIGLVAWVLRPSASPDAVAPSSTAATSTTVGVTPEIQIPDALEPRPIDPAQAVSPDWASLDPGPLTARWPAVAAWTGREIVFWGGEPIGGGTGLAGGAAFSPDSGEWRELSEGPLPPAPEASWVWTGDELVIWTPTMEAAAWNPLSNSWRRIQDWPLRGSFYTLAVWTGDGILDLGSGLLVDHRTGATQVIAEPPPLNSRASVVWTGGNAVIVTGEGAYDSLLDEWIDMPSSGLTPLAAAGAWTGSEVVAADYLMSASAYRPSSNTWTQYPNVPLRFSECAPTVHVASGVPIVSHCSGLAVWNGALSSWLPIGIPHATRRVETLLSADGQVYAWGEGFYRLDAERMDSPTRLAVGVGFLDLPVGWAISGVSSETTVGPSESFVEVTLVAPGDTCTVRAIHADAEVVLAEAISRGPAVGELAPNVGGASWETLEFLPSSSSDRHQILWAALTTDVFDVSCTSEGALGEIAPAIWTHYQPVPAGDLSVSGPSAVAGTLPDGTGYQLTFDAAFSPGEPEGISAAIVIDLEEGSEAASIIGCSGGCSPVIGITTFAREVEPGPRYLTGLDLFQVPSGGWTMNVDLYDSFVQLWGDDVERLLTQSIRPVDAVSGLPAFSLEPPFRWATDTEIPLQMQVAYEEFVVRRGCDDLSVACSADEAVQVIAAEKVFAPAPAWDYERQVTISTS